ncbi:hypothetical protein, partial [Burkholderia cepacia]|uniref:hypothetical protein n=1 Tax=Burkholderia cepacia TaxID=292 RepID=UPI002AAF9E55
MEGLIPRHARAVREVREFYRRVEARQKRKSAIDMSRSNNASINASINAPLNAPIDARTGRETGARGLHTAYHGSEYVFV